MKLDEIDKHILVKLQENAKITNTQLAKEVGLSPAPTLERVKKLEQCGLIKNYHAELNTDILGLGVAVFIQASLSGSHRTMIKSFMEKIDDIPEIVECHHVTGSSDFLLKILTKDINSYNDLILDKLVDIEEIENMQSMVVLSTLKDSKVLPV
ncbi:MAG: Lrp/AsnC family transcriptional regulator [Cytophagales bacterium]|nr:Lrp/AsnC family transcriptional regulator [Cytophagales bacterium]